MLIPLLSSWLGLLQKSADAGQGCSNSLGSLAATGRRCRKEPPAYEGQGAGGQAGTERHLARSGR
jgi:hypothetical protein